MFARRFSRTGATLGAEFQVNTYTMFTQTDPQVAADADGDFVGAWQSNPQDGSNNGVFAQRFADPAALDVDGNGAVDGLTDGLLALRYVFGFRGAVLVTGAVDVVNCTRCNAASIEAHQASVAD